MNKISKIILKNYKFIWYVVLLLVSSIYIYKIHTRLNIFLINRDWIMFIIWIFIFLYPFINEFEILGFKLKLKVKDIENAVSNNERDINSIKNQINNINTNTNSNNIYNYYPNASPSTDKELDEIKNMITENEDIEFKFTDGPSEDYINDTYFEDTSFNDIEYRNLNLFKARFTIEKILKEKYWYIRGLQPEDTVNNKNIPIYKIIKVLLDEDMINKDILPILNEIIIICNAGVHDFEVTDKQFKFVQEMFPLLINELKK